MKNIIVGFSTNTKSIFSWLIRASERTPYSHVYFKYHDDTLNRYIYFQASHTLVNYMGSQVFQSQEKTIYEFEFNVSDDNFLQIKQFATSQAGKPYGVLSILGLAVVQLASFVGIKMHNPLKDAGKTWVCSQLVAQLLKNCDNIQLNAPINDITPKDMYNIVKNLPKDLDKE